MFTQFYKFVEISVSRPSVDFTASAHLFVFWVLFRTTNELFSGLNSGKQPALGTRRRVPINFGARVTRVKHGAR